MKKILVILEDEAGIFSEELLPPDLVKPQNIAGRLKAGLFRAALKKILRRHAGDEVKIIVSRRPVGKIKGLNGNPAVIPLIDYAGEALFSDLQETAVRYSSAWFKRPDSKWLGRRLSYAGVPLLNLIEMDLGDFFYQAVENVRLFENLIERERPALIYGQKNAYNWLLSEVLEKHALGKIRRPLSLLFEIKARSYLLLKRIKARIKPFLKSAGYVLEGGEPAAAGLPRKSGVLFIPLSRTTLDYLEPVYQALKKQSLKIRLLIPPNLDWKEAEGRFGGGDLEPLSKREKKDGRRGVKKILAGYIGLGLVKRLESEFVIDGISYWNAFLSLYDYLFYEKMAFYAGEIDRFDALLKKVSPELLYTFQDKMGQGRLYVSLAKARGIKTVVAHSGLLIDKPLLPHITFETIESEPGRRLKWGLTADYWFVMGERLKRQLIENGFESSRIIVAGLPKLNDLAAIKSLPEEEILGRIGLSPGVKRILFAAQLPARQDKSGLPERYLVAREVIEKAAGIPGSDLIIKIHPDSTQAEEMMYRFLADSIPGAGKIVLLREFNILELIKVSDCVITVLSTTGMEAMLFGKPVVCVNFSGRPFPIAYHEFSGALGVRTKEELARALQDCLFDEAVKKKLKEKSENYITGLVDFTSSDGNGTAEKIISLLDKSPVSIGL